MHIRVWAAPAARLMKGRAFSAALASAVFAAVPATAQQQIAAVPATIQPGNYAGRFWMFTMVLRIDRAASGEVSGSSTITNTRSGHIQIDPFEVRTDPTGKFTFQLQTGSTVRLQPCAGGLCGMVDSYLQRARTDVVLAKE